MLTAVSHTILIITVFSTFWMVIRVVMTEADNLVEILDARRNIRHLQRPSDIPEELVVTPNEDEQIFQTVEEIRRDFSNA